MRNIFMDGGNSLRIEEDGIVHLCDGRFFPEPYQEGAVPKEIKLGKTKIKVLVCTVGQKLIVEIDGSKFHSEEIVIQS